MESTAAAAKGDAREDRDDDVEMTVAEDDAETETIGDDGENNVAPPPPHQHHHQHHYQHHHQQYPPPTPAQQAHLHAIAAPQLAHARREHHLLTAFWRKAAHDTAALQGKAVRDAEYGFRGMKDTMATVRWPPPGIYVRSQVRAVPSMMCRPHHSRCTDSVRCCAVL